MHLLLKPLSGYFRWSKILFGCVYKIFDFFRKKLNATSSAWILRSGTINLLCCGLEYRLAGSFFLLLPLQLPFLAAEANFWAVFEAFILSCEGGLAKISVFFLLGCCWRRRALQLCYTGIKLLVVYLSKSFCTGPQHQNLERNAKVVLWFVSVSVSFLTAELRRAFGFCQQKKKILDYARSCPKCRVFKTNYSYLQLHYSRSKSNIWC